MKIPVLLIIPKGNQVNRICEVNLQDGSTCFLNPSSPKGGLYQPP